MLSASDEFSPPFHLFTGIVNPGSRTGEEGLSNKTHNLNTICQELTEFQKLHYVLYVISPFNPPKSPTGGWNWPHLTG